MLDYSAHEGNPADAPLLAPAIARIAALFGKPPGAVTADRGYGEATVDADLTDLGVATVVIPRKGKPSAARRLQRIDRPVPAIRRFQDHLRVRAGIVKLSNQTRI